MNDTRAEFLEHLEELRFTLIRSLVAATLGAIVASIFVREILALLQYPFSSALGSNEALIYTRPGEAFGTLIQVVLVSGVLIALPAILLEAWAFAAPGLTPTERRYAGRALPLALLLFVAGIAFSYLTLPLAVKVLHGTGRLIGLRALWSLSACIVFLLWMCLLLGLLFQLPLIMGVLSAIGIVPSATFARGRRYAIFIIVAAVAVITPTGDVFTLTVISVPLVFLYEAGILLGRRLEPREQRAPD